MDLAEARRRRERRRQRIHQPWKGVKPGFEDRQLLHSLSALRESVEGLGESVPSPRSLEERSWAEACKLVDDELGMERGFSYQKTVRLKPEGPKAYYAWSRLVDLLKAEAETEKERK